ncbi:MAG TPA: MFS transporter [Candidatus Paceibacterota bacterium]|nr:MFS transporter [Candidatus Paceibacterota bacterium]
MKRKRGIVPIVFFTVFMDILGFGLVIPVIPQLIANPHAALYIFSSSASLKVGLTLLGILIAVYPLGQFFASPILGQLSDQYGRKRLLAICIFGASLAYIVFTAGVLVESVTLMILARLVGGLFGGNITIAQTILADTTEAKERTTAFGVIGAAYGLGFILGPFIGGILSDSNIYSSFGPAVPFMLAALLSFVNSLFVIFILPETLKEKSRTVLRWGKAFSHIAEAFRDIQLRKLFIANLLFFSGFTFFTSFISAFLGNKLGIENASTIGSFFAFAGICLVLAQVLIIRFLSRKYHERTILRVALPTAGILLIFFIVPKSLTGIYALVPLFAVFIGLVQANMNSLISKVAPGGEEGRIMGINTSVIALGQMFPPAIAGVLAAGTILSAPIILGGTLVLLSSVFFWRK